MRSETAVLVILHSVLVRTVRSMLGTAQAVGDTSSDTEPPEACQCLVVLL